MRRLTATALASCATFSLIASTPHATPLERPVLLAQQDAAAVPAKTETPEERMSRRFPQKVRVGDLIGLPVLDNDLETLGHIQEVVRSPAGKIRLIVSYSRWFGWFGRPVAVPIEVVAIAGREIDSLDMPRQEYEKSPTWSSGTDRPVPDDEIIRIAITR